MEPSPKDGVKMVKKLLIILLAVAFLAVLTSDPPAERGPIHKLYRGVINVLTGWVELPLDVYEVTVEDGIILGVSLGVLAGMAMSIARTGSGMYDIVTFFVPLPEDYASTIQPEFVWEY